MTLLPRAWPTWLGGRTEPAPLALPTEVVVLQTRVAQLQAERDEARTERHTYIAKLEALLDEVRADRERALAEAAKARDEADALAARLIPGRDTEALARANKTLLRYENILAGYEGRPTQYCRRCAPQPAPSGALL